MARRGLGIVAVFALALAWLPLLSSGAGADPPADGGVVPGAWIVAVAPGASPDDVAADHGRRLGASVDHVYRHAARGYAARMSAGAAAKAAADRRVASVVPDRYVSIAAKPGGGSPAPLPDETTPTGVERVRGGASAGAPVAVIDTGIDLSHPDLNVSKSVGRNCSTGSSFSDGNGHGTHVAGTIGAKKGNGGVVGVAPNTLLYSVRVLNNAGSGTWSSVICGVNWVAANAVKYGIKVANMSLGGGGSDGSCSPGLHQAICDAVNIAKVTFVVAAGNESDDAGNHVPAAYDEVITVSALADSDGAPGGTWPTSSCWPGQEEETLASFSNYGTDVDLIAPGVCVRSTWKGGGYSTISGTSMASPHVAAGAALYLTHHPDATPAMVQTGLIAEGGLDWTADNDGKHEPLLRVDSLYDSP